MTQRRYDPVTAQWRTVGTRCGDGIEPPAYGDCPLCLARDPSRPTGIPAARYQIVVLDNPQPMPTDRRRPAAGRDHWLYQARTAGGADEIVVYTDRHGAGLADLPVEHLSRLVDVWADRYALLGGRDDVDYVLVGEVHRPDAKHPHGVIQGYSGIPPLPARELAAARGHQRSRGTCVHCDVVAQEDADGDRIVADNGYFVAFVPFAGRMPYEVHIAVRRHAPSLLDLSDPERAALGRLLKTVAGGFSRLTGSPLPYVMALHQAPTDDAGWLPLSHFHVEFTPVPDVAGGIGPGAFAEIGAGAHVTAGVPEDMATDLRRAVHAAS